MACEIEGHARSNGKSHSGEHITDAVDAKKAVIRLDWDSGLLGVETSQKVCYSRRQLKVDIVFTLLEGRASPYDAIVPNMLELLPKDESQDLRSDVGYSFVPLFFKRDGSRKSIMNYDPREAKLFSLLCSKSALRSIARVFPKFGISPELEPIVSGFPQINRYKPGESVGWHEHSLLFPDAKLSVVVTLLDEGASGEHAVRQHSLELRLPGGQTLPVVTPAGSCLIMPVTCVHRVLPVEGKRIVAAFDVGVKPRYFRV